MNPNAVKDYLLVLQQRIVATLEELDGRPFREDRWDRPQGGGGISRVIEEGRLFERGGVNFSHVQGSGLPASASASRPELAGRAWEAMGVSLVLHPRNPYCPTAHMNVRFFVATAESAAPAWWFGGGMDLVNGILTEGHGAIVPGGGLPCARAGSAANPACANATATASSATALATTSPGFRSFIGILPTHHSHPIC